MHQGLQAAAGQPVGFGVVPAGTGNDFAAGTGVPADPYAAAEAIATALRTGREHRVDLARVTGAAGETRWFGAVLAAGFDAIVNERANRLRRPRGRLRYDLAILVELARPRPRAYRLELDGVDHSFAGTLVAVGNCASYGGGLRILPAADPADGLLDVVIAAPLGRAALVRLRPRLRLGTHVTDRGSRFPGPPDPPGRRRHHRLRRRRTDRPAAARDHLRTGRDPPAQIARRARPVGGRRGDAASAGHGRVPR